MPARILALTLIPIALVLSINSARGDELLVAVASNFLSTAQELAEGFEQQSGHHLRLSSGSTGKLYAQILHGAPYAILLAANAREPQHLEEQGLTVAGSRYTYALGTLALWSADPQLLRQEPEALLRAGRFHTLALANPSTAPYGAAGQQVLQRLKVAEGSYRLLRAENVTQAYQYVATGSAELGFVAYSQLLAGQPAQAGSVWLPPQDYYPAIRQQAVLLRSAAADPRALAFMAYLRTPAVRALIRRHGYGVEG